MYVDKLVSEGKIESFQLPNLTAGCQEISEVNGISLKQLIVINSRIVRIGLTG